MALLLLTAQMIVEGFRALGLPADAIARRHGISLQKAPPHVALPESVFLTLWKDALQNGANETIAAQIGFALPLGACGPGDYLSCSANTVGEAITAMNGDVLSLATNDLHLQIDKHGANTTVKVIHRRPSESVSWSEELIFGIIVSRCQRCAESFALHKVELTRKQSADTDAWKKLFNAPVEFNRPLAAMHLPPFSWSLPSRLANPQLRAAINYLIPKQHCSSSSLIPALRACLLARLEEPLTSSRAARSLGVSLRALQRHLLEQQTSFREVLDQLRHEQAETLLANSSLSLFEIAQRLGFEEQASFTRAFRRWTGSTPRQWRSRNHHCV